MDAFAHHQSLSSGDLDLVIIEAAWPGLAKSICSRVSTIKITMYILSD